MGRRVNLGTAVAVVVAVLAVLVAAATVSAGGDRHGESGAASASPVQPPHTTIHGSACQPANLQQSINRNTSWSRDGVRNPNPLGSGIEFFVVCPVVHNDDDVGTAVGADIEVALEYQNRDAVNRVSCTAFRFSDYSAPPVNSVSVTDTSGGTGPLSLNLWINDVIKDSDLAFNGFDESAVVRCKLPPQSGIRGIATWFDS